MKVYAPESGWSERIIAPSAETLAFIDLHWKAMIILFVPVVGPFAIQLARRVKRIGGVELNSTLDVKPEKPRRRSPSDQTRSKA